MIKKIYNSLSDAEKAIFNKYKSNEGCFSYNLNDSLRENLDLSKFANDIKLLDKVIGKNKYTGTVPITLYRATIEELVLPFIKESKYINPEYLSTATDPESIKVHFTNPHAPMCMELICSKGTRMISLETDQFGGMENEILLGRGNTFRVLEDRVTVCKNEIETIMSREQADGVASLRIISVTNVPPLGRQIKK